MEPLNDGSDPEPSGTSVGMAADDPMCISVTVKAETVVVDGKKKLRLKVVGKSPSMLSVSDDLTIDPDEQAQGQLRGRYRVVVRLPDYKKGSGYTCYAPAVAPVDESNQNTTLNKPTASITQVDTHAALAGSKLDEPAVLDGVVLYLTCKKT